MGPDGARHDACGDWIYDGSGRVRGMKLPSMSSHLNVVHSQLIFTAIKSKSTLLKEASSEKYPSDSNQIFNEQFLPDWMINDEVWEQGEQLSSGNWVWDIQCELSLINRNLQFITIAWDRLTSAGSFVSTGSSSQDFSESSFNYWLRMVLLYAIFCANPEASNWSMPVYTTPLSIG